MLEYIILFHTSSDCGLNMFYQFCAMDVNDDVGSPESK